MFHVLGKGKFIKYLDYPQNFLKETGGTFYINELRHILTELKKINGAEVTDEKLWKSIRLYNYNRNLIENLYNLKQEYPWRISTEDLYYIIRAGMVMPVEEHNDILENVLEIMSNERGEPMDKIRVVITGAFCEQPPIGLIKTIEMAGCFIVDDDFLVSVSRTEKFIKQIKDSGIRKNYLVYGRADFIACISLPGAGR